MDSTGSFSSMDVEVGERLQVHFLESDEETIRKATGSVDVTKNLGEGKIGFESPEINNNNLEKERWNLDIANGIIQNRKDSSHSRRLVSYKFLTF